MIEWLDAWWAIYLISIGSVFALIGYTEWKNRR